MTSLQSSITRLSLFRGSFPDGQICEETGLSTDDLDVILKALDDPIAIRASRDATDDVVGLTTCTTCGQSFSLNDAEAVSFHDQEMHEAR